MTLTFTCPRCDLLTPGIATLPAGVDPGRPVWVTHACHHCDAPLTREFASMTELRLADEQADNVFPLPEVVAAMETLVAYARTLDQSTLSYEIPGGDNGEPGGFLLLCLGAEGERALLTWSRLHNLAELHRERREGAQQG